jgi:hypothetical protein
MRLTTHFDFSSSCDGESNVQGELEGCCLACLPYVFVRCWAAAMRPKGLYGDESDVFEGGVEIAISQSLEK